MVFLHNLMFFLKLEIELKTEEAKYNKIYNDALAVFKNTVKVFVSFMTTLLNCILLKYFNSDVLNITG